MYGESVCYNSNPSTSLLITDEDELSCRGCSPFLIASRLTAQFLHALAICRHPSQTRSLTRYNLIDIITRTPAVANTPPVYLCSRFW